MQNLTNFIKYNNTFVIILGFLFLAGGSSFASEKVRDTVIGETIEEIKGMDNSALLAIDLDSLKQEMQITDVTEDEEYYNINYSFSTFDIKDYAWQNQTKSQSLRVPKDALSGGKDLGLHVQKELSQIIDSQLIYLKEAQKREQSKGETKIVKVTKYTGLKGLVLNTETKELEGYEPVMEKEERKDSPYEQPVQATSDVASLASSSSEFSSSVSSETSSSSSEQSSSVSSSETSSSSESSSLPAEETSSSSETASSSSESASSSSSESSSSESASSSSESSSSVSSEASSSSLPAGEASSSSSSLETVQ